MVSITKLFKKIAISISFFFCVFLFGCRTNFESAQMSTWTSKSLVDFVESLFSKVDSWEFVSVIIAVIALFATIIIDKQRHPKPALGIMLTSMRKKLKSNEEYLDTINEKFGELLVEKITVIKVAIVNFGNTIIKPSDFFIQ